MYACMYVFWKAEGLRKGETDFLSHGFFTYLKGRVTGGETGWRESFHMLIYSPKWLHGCYGDSPQTGAYNLSGCPICMEGTQALGLSHYLSRYISKKLE